MLLLERAEQFYRQLNTELKRFSPGDRFHTVREMVREFDVSYRVVMAVITRLEREGMLERRNRSGLYVRTTVPRRSVAFFYIDWPDGHPRRIAENFGHALQELGDYDFIALPCNYQSELIPQLEACPSDVIITGWPMRVVSPAELIWMGQFQKTLVICDRVLRDISHHCFYANNGYVAQLALNCFRRNGHRRIGVLLAEPPFGGNNMIYRSFLSFAPLHGCKPVPIECHAVSGNYSPEQAHRALSEHLDRFGLDFTGLFVISGYAAQGVLRSFFERGLSVPEAVSIITFGNPETTAYLTPPLTTIADCEEEMARLKAAAVHRYLCDPASGPITVESKAIIYEHGSVRNLTNNKNIKRNEA